MLRARLIPTTFAAAQITGDPDLAIEDGYRGLVWIDAAERSARDGRTIAL